MRSLTRQTAAGRLEARLREDIASGVLPPLSTLAGTPLLATRYEVSLVTAQKVLKKLSGEGLLIRRNGAPTIVAPRRNRIVGVLLPNMKRELTLAQSGAHYLSVSGILDECNKHDYHMIIINTRDKKVTHELLRELGVTGLIALYPHGNDELLQCVQTSAIPFVCVNLLDSKDIARYNCLNFDYVAAGRQVWEYFKKRSCKNPAFYLGTQPFREYQHRYWIFEGFKNAAATDGITVQVIDAVECGMIKAQIAPTIDSIFFGESSEMEEYCSLYGKDRELFGFFYPSTTGPSFVIDYPAIGRKALQSLAENSLPQIGKAELLPLKYVDAISMV